MRMGRPPLRGCVLLLCCCALGCNRLATSGAAVQKVQKFHSLSPPTALHLRGGRPAEGGQKVRPPSVRGRPGALAVKKRARAASGHATQEPSNRALGAPTEKGAASEVVEASSAPGGLPGGRAKMRRRGGKRGKAQRTHLRAWKEENGSPRDAGATGASTAPPQLKAGGAQVPQMVIQRYHVLQKKLAQAVKRNATHEAQRLEQRIKDAGGAAAYQKASSRSQAAGQRKGGRFNSTQSLLNGTQSPFDKFL